MPRAAVVALLCLSTVGCAHHQNQYAYAPPLAPPVYPQPQPVAAPALPPAQPGVVAPPVVPGPVPQAAAAEECCPPLGAGEVMAAPVVYESEQTPPCPSVP